MSGWSKVTAGTFGVLLAIVLATAALPGNAQTAAPRGQTATPGGQTAPRGQTTPGGQTAASGGQTVTPDAAAQKTPELSLFTLLDAAAGGHAVWRPDWPLDAPPDLFYSGSSALAEYSVLSIIADFGDGNRLEFSRDTDGRTLSFPLLMITRGEGAGKPEAAAANTGPEAKPDDGQESKVFFQGRCEYDREGRLSKLAWRDPLAQSAESDAEVLRWDDDGRPLLWRIFSGEYYFAALEYSGDTLIETWIETWYDREGTGLFVVITESEKQTKTSAAQDGPRETRFFYNSWGLLSGIEEPSGDSVSALYNQQGMPRYLELTAAGNAVMAGNGGGSNGGGSNGGGSNGGGSNGTGNNASTQRLVYTYQWDAAGKLVRFSGGSPAVDCRYEYTLDSRGNWTERKEYSMKALGQEDWGRLVPYREITVRRIIKYGELPKAEEPPKADTTPKADTNG